MTPSPSSSPDPPGPAAQDPRDDRRPPGRGSSRRRAMAAAGALAAGAVGTAAGAGAMHWHDGRRSPTFRVAPLPSGSAGARSTSVTFRAAPGAGMVALTFDDGPDPRWTPEVLDMLSALGAKATFFVLGQAVRAHPGLVASEVAQGHEVAVHNWVHTDVYGASPEELAGDLDRTIEEICRAGAPRARLWRPPYGRVDAVALAAAAQRNLDLVLWSLHTPSTAQATAVGSGAQDGAIILCHDGRSQPSTGLLQAVGRSVQRIQDRGLRVVTASELLAAGGAG